MATRKRFLRSLLYTAGLSVAAQGSGEALAVPTPTPQPTATPIPQPSALARQLAQSLQHALPKAHLSDAMVEKIAEDIQGNFSIGDSMMTAHSDRLPPPDFVFAASSGNRP
jgi:hypothetical protein